MSLIMNTLEDEQTVVVGGSHFHFKPKQIKHFYQQDIARTLLRNNQELGFVELPDDLEYLCHLPPGKSVKETILPEHQAIIDERTTQGVDAYCRHLRALVYNAQVSLKQDLDKANIKSDVRTWYSKGDLKNMTQLLKYQSKHMDESQERVNQIKEIEKKLAVIE